MITQDINIDEDLNQLSVEAQLLFIRIISVSDDCGVVPGNEYTLKSLTNPPDKIRNKFHLFLEEITNSKLLLKFDYLGKPYYCFKRESFDRQQAYLIKNRTKSEYLKINKEEFFALYSEISSLPEISGNNSKFPQVSSLTHKEIKDNSNKIKDKRDPNFEEVKEYILSKGFNETLAKKVFEYYDTANWHDSRGVKVKNWKQKILANWLTDNNKSETKPKEKLVLN